MPIEESGSLQFNNISWRASYLGESTILLECSQETPIEKIHLCTQIIEQVLGDSLQDIVPAYHSIAVFTPLSIAELGQLLERSYTKKEELSIEEQVIELPICYELGMDLERMANYADLSIDEFIIMHSNEVYRSLFIGFTPGFIYADGLNDALACPRLDSPRKKIPEGSVGIAGNQTGIYSLESPGGWNIIGRTPVRIFNLQRQPPMLINVGTKYRFCRITKDEFETWGS